MLEDIELQFLTNKEFSVKLGQTLRQVRMERKASQTLIANRAATDRFVISKIENGERLPSSYMLYKLLKGLEISADDFFAILEKNKA